MKFALFLGCNIPVRVPQYEMSARAVLDKLGIETADIPEFKCCGNPIRNTDQQTFVLMAARNLALAEEKRLDLLVLCKCCFGSLKKAAHLMQQDQSLRASANRLLAREGLKYTGRAAVKHLLSVLYHDTGVDVLKKQAVNAFKNLKIAAHHGCHALRPSEITQFDDPVAPVVFDALVAATGARSLEWPLKLECCGAPLLGVNDDLALSLTRRKVADSRRAGADVLCVACPYCQMQFERMQQVMAGEGDTAASLPSIVFPQLLGLAMGIEGDALGLDRNMLEISTISRAE